MIPNLKKIDFFPKNILKSKKIKSTIESQKNIENENEIRHEV